MQVDSSVASQYQYTMKFTNVDSQSYKVQCWPKSGPAGDLTGFFSVNASPVSFSIAAGATQHVAFEGGSIGACGFAPGSSLPTTPWGEWAGTWVEYEFGSQDNSGWNGADCSSLVAVSAGLSTPGCQVCHGGTCSTINPDGSGTNAYIAGTAAADGLGLNIPQTSGNIELDVSVGYQ
jgi:hypothetical protein